MEVYPGFDIPLYLGLLLLTCLLVYIYATWPYGQFQKLGISGPPPEPFFGNQRQLFSKGTTYALKKWSDQFGRVYGIYMGRQPVVVISDLDILKSVLVKDFAHFTNRGILNRAAQSSLFQKSVLSAEGADWKRIRSIITPTFSAGKLRLMEPHIDRCSRDLTDNLQKMAQHGQIVNVKEYFGAYTLDVIASTAFGLQVNSQKDLSDPFLVNVKAMLGGAATKKFRIYNTLLALMPCLSPLVSRVRTTRLFSGPISFYRDNIQSMIKQRKAADRNQSKVVDFLQLLINAEDSGAAGSSKHLTQEEVEAQMLIFFFAGYETTGTTLTYLAYNLAMHPDVQQRIVEEMEQELGEEMPTYENVSKLKYMEQTVQETLRLFSPVTMVNRQASETVTIKGVTIPKGFGVTIPIWKVMRDPEYFPNPEVFDPDRFSDKGGVEPISFLAFGFGPRICIGMRLALLEIKVAMVHVLRQIQFVRTPDLPETIQFKQGVGGLLSSASPLMIKLVSRHADKQTL